MSPIKALAMMQPKTTSLEGVPGGGVSFNKMIVPAAMAGLNEMPYKIARLIYCEDRTYFSDVLISTWDEAHKVVAKNVSNKIDGNLAMRICVLAMQHTEAPMYKYCKKEKASVLVQYSNYRLEQELKLPRGEFKVYHEQFYNTCRAILEDWLGQAFRHIRERLQD